MTDIKSRITTVVTYTTSDNTIYHDQELALKHQEEIDRKAQEAEDYKKWFSEHCKSSNFKTLDDGANLEYGMLYWFDSKESYIKFENGRNYAPKYAKFPGWFFRNCHTSVTVYPIEEVLNNLKSTVESIESVIKA